MVVVVVVVWCGTAAAATDQYSMGETHSIKNMSEHLLQPRCGQLCSSWWSAPVVQVGPMAGGWLAKAAMRVVYAGRDLFTTQAAHRGPTYGGRVAHHQHMYSGP